MPVKGFRNEKKPSRMERLEQAVTKLSSMPQFLLQNFQQLAKVVQDVRFTIEVYGRILQNKGIISQEEVTTEGKKLIEERKKAEEEKVKKMKEEAAKKTAEAKDAMSGKATGQVVETLSAKDAKKALEVENLKDNAAKELMKSRADLQKEQTQDVDVSVKKID